MASTVRVSRLRPGLYCFRDTCNVYVIVRESGCLVIDFGSGRWLSAFKRLKLPPITDLFLTHHHADQCAGLANQRRWPFKIHAPAAERPFLSPAGVKAFWKNRYFGPIPASYSVLSTGLQTAIRYDMIGFADCFVGNERVRFIATPGHGPNALTVVLDHRGEQIAFCGDAANEGATIHEPYHLEWDHWTGSGALAAWEGIRRLAGVHVDLLCPSHGPSVERPRAMLLKLSDKLLDFYHAKGNICPDEPDRYLEPKWLRCGAAQILPDLFQFGTNGYLLRSRSGESLVVDHWTENETSLDALLQQFPELRVTAGTATHYHCDHSDGLPSLKKRFGATIYLHPWVAAPIGKNRGIDAPWLPREPITPDRLWPENGLWRWNEYEFRVAPFPGQTWWHACFMTRINETNVFFGGDNFQPNSRWNGTGGFSSMNGSRFREGFAASAELVLKWRPDVLACGHNTYYRFRPSHFRKIVRWAARAEEAVRALCPSGSLENDYHLHEAKR